MTCGTKDPPRYGLFEVFSSTLDMWLGISNGHGVEIYLANFLCEGLAVRIKRCFEGSVSNVFSLIFFRFEHQFSIHKEDHKKEVMFTVIF